MEHWLVALGPGRGDAVLDWAACHARGRAGLEVIVSALEVSDPHGIVLRAAERLRAECADVPCALHVVPRILRDELEHGESVDLVVVGSAGGRGDDRRVDQLLSLLRVCRSPVVLVAARAERQRAAIRDIVWSFPRRQPPAELVDAVRSGHETLRVVRAPGLPSGAPS